MGKLRLVGNTCPGTQVESYEALVSWLLPLGLIPGM